MEADKERPSTQEMVNGLVGNYLQDVETPGYLKDKNFMDGMMDVIEDINHLSPEQQDEIKEKLKQTGLVLSDVQAEHHKRGGGDSSYRAIPIRK